MIRGFLAYALAFVLTVTSFSLAHARGDNPDLNAAMDMVICTGTGMVTITIGPDGEPIESVHLCPDATSIFSAEFALPQLVHPVATLVARILPSQILSPVGRTELTPSARGPPVLA